MRIETYPNSIIDADAWNLCSYLDGFKGVVLGCNITVNSSTSLSISAGMIITSGKTWNVPAQTITIASTDSFVGATVSGSTVTLSSNSNLTFWSDTNDLFLNPSLSSNILIGMELGSNWIVNIATIGVDTTQVVALNRPVNSIVMFSNNTNPNNLFIGTTWTLLPDGFFLSLGGNGTTSGTALATNATTITSSTFTLSNVPSHAHNSVSHTHALTSHTHTYNGHTHTVGSHNHTQGTNVLGSSEAPSNRQISDIASGNTSVRWLATSNTNRSRGGTTTNTGGNLSSLSFNTGSTTMTFNAWSGNTSNWGSASVSGHNHTIPIGYLGVAIWRRTV